MNRSPPHLPIARLAVVAAITLVAATGASHVAPSVDDNNRYLKLTPLGDRVRLAYTVFFGDVPGASERRAIDANHDGQITEPEGHEFGLRISAQVAAALEVEVDGVVVPVKWEVVDVGMGTPAVAAGSFSVDMVTYLCLATARGRHRLVVRDRFRIPRPGETEVKVEDSPGIQIEHARVGAADDPSFDYRFAGPGGPLSDDGLDLQFTAGPKSMVSEPGQAASAGERRLSPGVAGACAQVAAPAPATGGGHALGFVLIAIGAVLLGGVVVVMRRVRNRG